MVNRFDNLDKEEKKRKKDMREILGLFKEIKRDLKNNL